MASSEENPASAAPESKNGTGTSEKSESSEKPKKKTLIGLGKLRESLKKSSSGNKSTSLRIPKPSSRKKKKTQLGLPSPKKLGEQNDDDAEASEESTEDEATTDRVEDVPEETFDDAEPDTDRIDGAVYDDEGPNTDQMSADELAKSLPGLAVPGAVSKAKATGADHDGAPADSSLIEDVELEEPVDAPMEAEATMLTDSPFEAASGFGAEPAESSTDADDMSADEDFGAEATMITDSPLDDDAVDEDDFGVEATMVTDSPLDDPAADAEFDGGEKTMVSAPLSETDPSHERPKPHVRPRRQTNPNPPTPEQQARSGQYAIPAVDRSGDIPRDAHQDAYQDAQQEATLDADVSDDDFSAVKTEVFDSPYENEALVARLSVLSGPAAGQEFLLNKQRNTIGRGKNNTIMIADLAMSRQHFEILEDSDQSYLLVDLQSANGSRLNSTRIEEAELFHGDRIEAGKTEFQFVIPGDRAQPRSRNRHLIPKREVSTPGGQNHTMVRQMGAEATGDDTTDKILTYVIIGAGVLSLFLIGAAGFLFLNDPGANKEVAAQAEPAEDPEAQKLYLEGVERVKDRDWDAARATFEKVGALDPEFPGVVAQLERVSREKKAQRHLEQARTLLGEDKDDEATEAASQISNDSVYFEDAQALIRKTRQRRVAALYQKAQEAVTAEKPEEAQEHLAAILEEVPNHKGALELQKTLEEGDTPEEEEEAEESSSSSRRSASASRRSNDDWLSGSGSSSSRSNSGSSTRINFTKGFSLYKSGKFGQAVSYFKKAASGSGGALARRANTTAKNIERFESTYKRAERAYDAGAWKTAIDSLEDAKRADRKVARTGYFKSEINAKLANAHGKIGLSEFAKGNYASANRHYTKGKRYSGSNSTVNSLRRKLSTKARSLYIQAANKRKTDPAKAGQLCRQIMSMVPSNHSMHQKAKKMLSEL
ncbi:FHA domain-containing protein [Persicimonas caeni]|uniref:FHA domain-containing protein n=1 Tax=Persicimonas caeni TaxID=2292766 RepID=A0A4Y6PQQ6_PERCE|nr:FHA domain-containing protein [Persicimonas caeni]QDG50658.1 FHA domain-containing protein [Persicimonas caeni]QED31879.1 FHA domain-containing protein [Persicimonas caeni]